MGAGKSKINQDYYDRHFGYNFGSQRHIDRRPDLTKAVYIPSDRSPHHLNRHQQVVALPRRPITPLPTQFALQQQQPVYVRHSATQENVPLPKKEKPSKNQKHPIPGKTYYYLEEPDVIFITNPAPPQQLALPPTLPQQFAVQPSPVRHHHHHRRIYQTIAPIPQTQLAPRRLSKIVLVPQKGGHANYRPLNSQFVQTQLVV